METQTFREPAAGKPVVALGLMSGTSKDGVDVVRLTTDGMGVLHDVRHMAHEYPRVLYEKLKRVGVGDIPLNDVLRLEQEVTRQYAAAIVASGFLGPEVAVIGCHGQTVRHLPEEGLTWQLGDPNLLAELLYEQTGYDVPVVADFRRRDMAAGGEGAPLAPRFHGAMLAAAGVSFGPGQPAAILNIGGVANVTLVEGAEEIRGTDCGPGMGLLDQFIQRRIGAAFDEGGALSLQGQANTDVVARALKELPFFQRPLPRSADRYEFNAMLEWLAETETADAAATLAALTVAGIDGTLRAYELSAAQLAGLYWSGGGGRNGAVLRGLHALGWPLKPVEDLGWEPLAVEAACFAWLAVRRLRGLPFALPGTTHCRRATVGGVLTSAGRA